MAQFDENRFLAIQGDLVTAPPGLVSDSIKGALVESTPAYPGYYYGNRLILNTPPTADSLDLWFTKHRKRFAWRIGDYPAVLTWYMPYSDLSAQNTIACDRHTVFIARRDVAPAPDSSPRERSPVEIFQDDAHWEQLVRLECEAYPNNEDFNAWRVASFRALVDDGIGQYYCIKDPQGAVVAAAGGFGDLAFAAIRGSTSRGVNSE